MIASSYIISFYPLFWGSVYPLFGFYRLIVGPGDILSAYIIGQKLGKGEGAAVFHQHLGGKHPKIMSVSAVQLFVTVFPILVVQNVELSPDFNFLFNIFEK